MRIFKYIFCDKEVSLWDFVVFYVSFILVYEFMVEPLSEEASRIVWKFLLPILEKIF